MCVGVLQIVTCYTATILILSIGKPTKNIQFAYLYVCVAHNREGSPPASNSGRGATAEAANTREGSILTELA